MDKKSFYLKPEVKYYRLHRHIGIIMASPGGYAPDVDEDGDAIVI